MLQWCVFALCAGVSGQVRGKLILSTGEHFSISLFIVEQCTVNTFQKKNVQKKNENVKVKHLLSKQRFVT